MIKIDKNVPVPSWSKGQPPKYPVAAMEIGDSFFVAGGRTGIVSNFQRKFPLRKFIQRKAIENGVDGHRIWRLE